MDHHRIGSQIGSQIALLRKERGFTQDMLAEKLSVSPQAVSKWENGHALPETASLPALARALECNIDMLFGLNALVVLDARYGDGLEQTTITRRMNRLIENDRLQTDSELLPPASHKRLYYLTVKYQNPKGLFYACFRQGEAIELTAESTHVPAPPEMEMQGLTILAGVYGNAAYYNEVMPKIRHYEVFGWNEYHADHEVFPSNPGNDDPDFLTLVYINANGIHLATCAEGESLRYNETRTDLQRTAQTDTRRLEVEQLPPFGQGMECSWANALTAALKAMGVCTDYTQVMGVSGACYRLAFCTPQWDYSAVDALVAYDYAMPGYQAFGYTPVCVGHVEKENRAAERARIVTQIKQGMPVLAINLRVAAEWGVIAGYGDNGNLLYCRTKYDDSDYPPADNWPFLILYFNNKTAPPDAYDNYLRSLRVFTACASIPESNGYRMGFSAYEAWIADLTDEAWYAANDDSAWERRLSVNQFMTLSLYDARKAAHIYLKQSTAQVKEEQRGDAEKLSELFGAIADRIGRIHQMLDTGQYLEGPAARAFWTNEKRKEQAGLLTEALALEREAFETASRVQ